jgi:replicative DNA helicase
LKSLSKELGICIIALSQLNRKSEDRKDRMPQLSDLRESGAIEQDADVVILIHREEYYNREHTDEKKKGKADIIIAKNRNGPVDQFELAFRPEFTEFRDLDYVHDGGADD